MQIRRVHAVYFSGTGTTEKTVRRIAAQAAQQLGAELSAMEDVYKRQGGHAAC